MIPATTAAGAVEEAWTPCVCCANAPAAAASIKNWQEDQTHAGIKYAQHLACLQRCDPFDCAFHIEAIMLGIRVIPVIRFGHASMPLLFKSDLAHSFCAEDFANVESLHGGGAALVFRTHDLLDDRIHFVA